MLYFGYGSLVNRQTRDAAEPFYTATLKGWKRDWAHRAQRPWSLSESSATAEKPGVCALTVSEAVDHQIDGVIGQVKEAHIESLDRREAGYRRITLPATAFSLPDELAPIAESGISLYVSAPENNHSANAGYPILMSYVDCVIAGFRHHFGDHGARRFMQTTTGWQLPLLDDRSQPLYPRAVSLTRGEQQLVDAMLAEFRDKPSSLMEN